MPEFIQFIDGEKISCLDVGYCWYRALFTDLYTQILQTIENSTSLICADTTTKTIALNHWTKKCHSHNHIIHVI